MRVKLAFVLWQKYYRKKCARYKLFDTTAINGWVFSLILSKEFIDWSCYRNVHYTSVNQDVQFIEIYKKTPFHSPSRKKREITLWRMGIRKSYEYKIWSLKTHIHAVHFRASLPSNYLRHSQWTAIARKLGLKYVNLNEHVFVVYTWKLHRYPSFFVGKTMQKRS